MKWNHLPEDGGLYKQNPDLLDHFYYIFGERAKVEAKEREAQKREADKAGGGRGLARTARGKRSR